MRSHRTKRGRNVLAIGESGSRRFEPEIGEGAPDRPCAPLKRIQVEQGLGRERILIVQIANANSPKCRRVAVTPGLLPQIDQRIGLHPPNRSPARLPATLGGMSERPRKSAEEKNEAARAGLDPLGPGERPASVTVAAIVAAVLALVNSALLVSGFDVRGGNATPTGGVLFAVLMFAAAAGMWRAKYWAVLGFQALLGISIVIASLSLLRAATLQGVLIPVAIIVPGGWLFWKLIRAMARIQMPQRPGDDHADTR